MIGIHLYWGREYRNWSTREEHELQFQKDVPSLVALLTEHFSSIIFMNDRDINGDAENCLDCGLYKI